MRSNNVLLVILASSTLVLGCGGASTEGSSKQTATSVRADTTVPPQTTASSTVTTNGSDSSRDGVLSQEEFQRILDFASSQSQVFSAAFRESLTLSAVEKIGKVACSYVEQGVGGGEAGKKIADDLRSKADKSISANALSWATIGVMATFEMCLNQPGS